MLDIAFSHCPNDTVAFYHWLNGNVERSFPINPTILDIEELNRKALAREFPVMKISFGVFPAIADEYVILPVGAAMGWGHGPKLVGRVPLNKLTRYGKIAIPGEHTTAKLLWQCLANVAESYEPVYCRYDQVTQMVKSGEVDVGIIIHETRFTFENDGLVELTDLGKVWHDTTGLPIPLGGIVAKKSLGQPRHGDICRILQHSIALGRADIDKCMDYILEHSIEQSKDVVRKHIDTFVTDETEQMTPYGRAAIQMLYQCSGDNLPRTTIFPWSEYASY